jgi:NADPH:quinone reductase-like Zn-dependent oxidoreductase
MEGASDLLEFIGVVSFPVTPGVDVCGIVRGIGAEVTTLSVGDAVMVDTGITVGGGMAE